MIGERLPGENLEIDVADLAFIRTLGDFDLTMLLSELHDHGWPFAARLMLLMRASIDAGPESPRTYGGPENV
jgi:hypothetical protein